MRFFESSGEIFFFERSRVCGHLRDGAGVVVVGDQAFAGIDPGGIQSANGEGVGDDQAGEQLAERKKIVAAAGSQFADCGQAAQEIFQLRKMRFEFRSQRGGIFLRRAILELLAGGARATTEAIQCWLRHRRLRLSCPMATSWSVTLAMALTTTTGDCLRRLPTIFADALDGLRRFRPKCRQISLRSSAHRR